MIWLLILIIVWNYITMENMRRELNNGKKNLTKSETRLSNYQVQQRIDKKDYRKDNLKLSKEELTAKIEVLGKRANTRLRQLETSNKTDTNAYRWVSNQVGKKSGITSNKKGQVIFKRGTKGLTKTQLVQRATDLEMFIDAKTSTVRGINQAYRKSYETYVKKYKIKDFSYDDYIAVMESANLEISRVVSVQKLS